MTISPLDWTLPETWLLAFLVLALLVLPIWLQRRQRGLSPSRKAVRLGLHGLLWLAVLGLWLQPRWQQTLPSGSILLAADNVPADYVRSTAADLGIKTTFSAAAFRAMKTTVPVDTVWLLGQDFPGDVLAKLSRQLVTWLPYNAPGQLQQLRWKGVVRQGEQQTVTGKLNTEEGGMLRLKFGQKTVDSTRLTGDDQAFKLAYVAFSRGRTQLTLWLDKTVLDTVRFVARPAEKLRVRFVLDAPDFETRALADWLGQQGNAVELTNRLSKGIGSELTINKATAGTLPDLVVTDPANVTNPLVSKSLAAGKSVLILNLTRPDVDVPGINRALRTSLQVRRIPGKDTIRISPDLTALPFRFQPAMGTSLVAGFPVAVQPVGGRVAISLLAETFPLRLSGDTTGYTRLWLSMLAPLRPAGKNNVQVDAPVLVHRPAHIAVNNASIVPTRLKVGADTLQLQPAPINARSYEATGRFARAGWLPVQDTLSLYAYGNVPEGTADSLSNHGVGAVAQREQVASWVRVHRRYGAAPGQTDSTAARTIEKAIPDWGWLLVIGLLLSALWIEPKLG
ncbi:hypothetical protein [Fibrivirga algicola]|uniref:Aerotolerance regulator N-terminal domain-containing protein n=1 Tax=Fibrivirga algicola TaxID=2950420 RepID=A0ABX0QSA9_9BACT|nr:hypothetical protein [Fibrivirga algicola]NID13034.1 hypothetical protein [Fibrivirga algicola]